MTIAFPHRNYRATLGTERLPILIEPTRADGRCAGDPPRAPGRDRSGRDLHRRAARRGHVRPQRRPPNSCRPTCRGWTKTCWVLTARASNLSSGSVSASAWMDRKDARRGRGAQPPDGARTRPDCTVEACRPGLRSEEPFGRLGPSCRQRLRTGLAGSVSMPVTVELMAFESDRLDRSNGD